MGGGHWRSDDWSRHSKAHIASKVSTTGVSGVFSNSRLDSALNPHNVMRESRDSVDNPQSTPIGIALDVTGSMGYIAEHIARKGLPLIAEEIYKRKPVTNPHIMFMGVGDAYHDSAPFQATQFEADIRIAEQLQKLYLEGGGGGNRHEGYILPYYFFARHVVTDHNEKRGKRGVLITIGDEEPTPKLLKEQAKQIFGDDLQDDLSMDQVLAMVAPKFDVFHIIVEQGSHMRFYAHETVKKWKELLGQRVIMLSDYEKLGEVIVSLLQVNAGHDIDDVVESWDGSTSLVVRKAVSSLAVVQNDESGIVEL